MTGPAAALAELAVEDIARSKAEQEDRGDAEMEHGIEQSGHAQAEPPLTTIMAATSAGKASTSQDSQSRTAILASGRCVPVSVSFFTTSTTNRVMAMTAPTTSAAAAPSRYLKRPGSMASSTVAPTIRVWRGPWCSP